ncbi:hypothetical protein BJX65DRAFT_278062 [Aspergillus insuetus]
MFPQAPIKTITLISTLVPGSGYSSRCLTPRLSPSLVREARLMIWPFNPIWQRERKGR